MGCARQMECSRLLPSPSSCLSLSNTHTKRRQLLVYGPRFRVRNHARLRVNLPFWVEKRYFPTVHLKVRALGGGSSFVCAFAIPSPLHATCDVRFTSCMLCYSASISLLHIAAFIVQVRHNAVILTLVHHSHALFKPSSSSDPNPFGSLEAQAEAKAPVAVAFWDVYSSLIFNSHSPGATQH